MLHGACDMCCTPRVTGALQRAGAASWDVCEAVRHGWLPPRGATDDDLPDAPILFHAAREFLAEKQILSNRTVSLQHVRYRTCYISTTSYREGTGAP